MHSYFLLPRHLGILPTLPASSQLLLVIHIPDSSLRYHYIPTRTYQCISTQCSQPVSYEYRYQYEYQYGTCTCTSTGTYQYTRSQAGPLGLCNAGPPVILPCATAGPTSHPPICQHCLISRPLHPLQRKLYCFVQKPRRARPRLIRYISKLSLLISVSSSLCRLPSDLDHRDPLPAYLVRHASCLHTAQHKVFARLPLNGQIYDKQAIATSHGVLLLNGNRNTLLCTRLLFVGAFTKAATPNSKSAPERKLRHGAAASPSRSRVTTPLPTAGLRPARSFPIRGCDTTT